MKKQSIFFADDHIALRDSLAMAINTFDFCFVSGMAGDGTDLVHEFSNGMQADIVILDLLMPIMDGYAAAAWLKQNRPEIKILVFTMGVKSTELATLLKSNVRGIINKNSDLNEVEAALRAITDNDTYFCKSAAAQMARLFQGDKPATLGIEKVKLTDIEKEFLSLCNEDLSFKEIQGKMNLPKHKLEKVRGDLKNKLNIKTRNGLLRYAAKMLDT